MEGGVTLKNTTLLVACLALAYLLLHRALGWGNLTTVGMGLGVALLIDCLPGVTYSRFWFGRTVLIVAGVALYWWILWTHSWLVGW